MADRGVRAVGNRLKCWIHVHSPWPASRHHLQLASKSRSLAVCSAALFGCSNCSLYASRHYGWLSVSHLKEYVHVKHVAWLSRANHTGEGSQIWVTSECHAQNWHLHQLNSLLSPTELVIRNDSWQHRHHAPMKAQGGGSGETRKSS